MNSALASGRAHVAGPEGGEPTTPEAWGWREVVIGAGDNERQEWRPQGERVGWIDGDDLYLQPDAAFAVAQRLSRETEDWLPASLQTLKNGSTNAVSSRVPM